MSPVRFSTDNEFSILIPAINSTLQISVVTAGDQVTKSSSILHYWI